ncbi:hypothetical protein PENTCL1PPCAC_20420, partial [Pristionchus entomophagus]
ESTGFDQHMSSLKHLRAQACDLSKSDRIGHVIARTFDLIGAVQREGVGAESVSELVELLAQDRAFSMKRDNNVSSPLRDLVYGMIAFLSSMIEDVAKKRIDELLQARPAENTNLAADLLPQLSDGFGWKEEHDDLSLLNDVVVTGEEPAELEQVESTDPTEPLETALFEIQEEPATSQQAVPQPIPTPRTQLSYGGMVRFEVDDSLVKMMPAAVVINHVAPAPVAAETSEKTATTPQPAPQLAQHMCQQPLSDGVVKLEDDDGAFAADATMTTGDLFDAPGTSQQLVHQPSPQPALFHDAVVKVEEDFGEPISFFDQRSGGRKDPAALHPCSICFQQFLTKGALASHLTVHKRKKSTGPVRAGRFTCDECSYTCTSRVAMEIHSCTHTGERPHKCTDCDKAFTSATLLKKHLRVDHGAQHYECPTCFERFERRWQLTAHKMEHDRAALEEKIRQRTEKPVLMPVDEASLKRARSLDQTLEGADPMDEEGPCASSEDAGTSQQKQMRLSDEDDVIDEKGSQKGTEDVDADPAVHRCTTCLRVFSNKASLVGHSNSAHNKRTRDRFGPVKAGKFACDFCSYTCHSKTALEIHLCTHTGERPHQCQHCAEGFMSSAFLSKHLRELHGVQPYECEMCIERFDRFSQLTHHKRTHFLITPESVSVNANDYQHGNQFSY